jgi:hypothetical protein
MFWKFQLCSIISFWTYASCICVKTNPWSFLNSLKKVIEDTSNFWIVGIFVYCCALKFLYISRLNYHCLVIFNFKIWSINSVKHSYILLYVIFSSHIPNTRLSCSLLFSALNTKQNPNFCLQTNKCLFLPRPSITAPFKQVRLISYLGTEKALDANFDFSKWFESMFSSISYLLSSQ